MDVSESATVYAFYTFDEGAERPELSKFKATPDAIAAQKGKLIEGTGETIDRAALDALGRYRRIATGWGELA